MAAVAALLIVHALELEVADVVQSDDVGETLSGVAVGAIGSELTFVDCRFRVAGAATVAILGTRLELDARVAICAFDAQVLSRELVVTLGIVIEDVLARLKVAGIALVAELSAVDIVLGVAPLGTTGRWRALVFTLGMTLSALRDSIVQPKKRPVCVVGVVELGSDPLPWHVTAAALIAQSPKV